VSRGLVSQRAPLLNREWSCLQKTLKFMVVLQANLWGKDRREAARSALLNRVDGLNRPTNRDKLLEPFRALDLKLTEEESRAIDQRNRLLHSERLLNVRELKKNPDAWHAALRVEQRLYTAMNKLLLKYLGYSGPLIDWERVAWRGRNRCTLRSRYGSQDLR